MLTELSIRNLAVIEQVRLSFRQGFHVLTGETGAGKSMIIDALSLIIGGRGSAELVRYGTDKAAVEGQFELIADHPVWAVLERLGIAADTAEQLIIRREISSQGKSSARINGQLVNLSMLREVGEYLVNIHGQHEHQSLLKTEQHLQWLDLFAGSELERQKQEYAQVFDRHAQILAELKELEQSGKQALQMADLYRFQVDEIENAALQPDEDACLLEEKRKLANAEKLFQASADAYEALYGHHKAVDMLSKATSKLEGIAGFDPGSLKPLLEQLQAAYYQVEDAAQVLRDYRDSIEFNPARLDEIERRLDLISGLRRKYGDTVQEILEYGQRIRKELDQLENKDEAIAKLRHKAAGEAKQLALLAARLSELRMTAARKLARQIEEELAGLQMSRTAFEVSMQQIEDSHGLEAGDKRLRFTREGWDQAEFLISSNPGEPLRSLAKVASGGELSRIMLAMKTIFARIDQIPVLVFDEVDTGVSGRAAQAIAEKLSALAASCQVFSITHLPQVAGMADAHFAISKETDGERTYTRVTDLQGDERVRELARMLGGVEITTTTLGHAKEMLSLANANKARS